MLPIKIVRRRYRVRLSGFVDVLATSEDDAVDIALDEAVISDFYVSDIDDLHETVTDYEVPEDEE